MNIEIEKDITKAIEYKIKDMFKILEFKKNTPKNRMIFIELIQVVFDIALEDLTLESDITDSIFRFG
ncbi:hypothetical protein [uncultured Arcobacter sp.]|uniref:hypothetical protein n=1 Tax=uncultured Arcobacter sp. TaxID=165434 RepID=UPI002628ECC3|nr:hypothetical protein [uncultured Arcobacter sp.]